MQKKGFIISAVLLDSKYFSDNRHVTPSFNVKKMQRCVFLVKLKKKKKKKKKRKKRKKERKKNP